MRDGCPRPGCRPSTCLELRTRTRLRHTLAQERTAWLQRPATLFHHGIDAAQARFGSSEGHAFLDGLELPGASAERIEVCLRIIERLDQEIAHARPGAERYCRAQPGARALSAMFGVGAVTGATILAELGDAGRLRRSRAAVRLAGLDIAVHRSDRRERIGRLTRQGSPHLRWALYEAAQ